MADLAHIRHTLAHLLAAAVQRSHPSAKLTLGPAVENGFYYDIDFGGEKITEDELPRLEAAMRELLPSWTSFSRRTVSADEAKRLYADNKYKRELIDEAAGRGEDITLYAAGDFEDLCRGGHAKHPAKEIDADAFRLDRIAGAYWRGDEKNTMLTRIYGLAFAKKAELDAYLARRAEAAKRDHRKLGKELDLFLTSELVGQGLPLWTPKGTIIRNELDAYVWELRSRYGYQRVTIPHLTKKDLYETSGHWAKFADELFRVTTREGKEYALKPMNCPHHTQIFSRKLHSYRDMPQRYTETTMVYRDEQSGELGGLTRVLSITQDDAHVFCRLNQVRDEFFKIWDIIETFYGSFGFKLQVRLSFHDPGAMEKYLGNAEIWKNAEAMLRDIARERKADYLEAPGEAAMYGPKLDFMATDSMGRQHQVATVQLDMNLPERFDLTCVNERGEAERIVIIHCAVMGSIERFFAVLIEHLAGVFPLWLSPVHVQVLPVSDKLDGYGRTVVGELTAAGIRAELLTGESLGKRIREVKKLKTPYYLVVGEKEVDERTVTIESRGGDRQTLPLSSCIVRLKEEITSRSL